MTWTKLDDTFHSHPKVRNAWRESMASIGLHALALSYAGQYETDGAIPGWFVESVIADESDRHSAVDALKRAGLWREVGEGFELHDYLKFNPSKATLEEKRAKDRERKAGDSNGSR